MNQERRQRLGDAAIEVLAEAGGRGLTHRAVDAAAEVPPGTAKNYFPTREALLRAVADRCVEQYLAVTAGVGPPPSNRDELATLLRALVEDVAGPGRSRLLAYLELQVEAARRPWLAAALDPLAATDFATFGAAQSAAGLPATPARAQVLTLAMHASIPHLLAGGPRTLAASGLDTPESFVAALLDTVYPTAEAQPTPAAPSSESDG